MSSSQKTLRTGIVVAGAYADKVRRTLFAQTKDLVKSGELSPQEVARAAGELNRLLYEILVAELKTEKGDAVRITVDYKIEEGKIVWDLKTLQIQLWKAVSQTEVNKAVAKIAAVATELLSKAIRFETEKAVELVSGDLVYLVKYGGRDVGALVVTLASEDKAIIRGAVLEPTPLLLRRTLFTFAGDIDEFMKTNVSQILSKAVNVEYREADKMVREIKAMVRAEIEAKEAEFEEEEE